MSATVAPASILVVEDDADVRVSVAEILTEEGYAVVTAGNGREALQLLEQMSRPGLILLDMMMPDIDGRGFLLEMRERVTLATIPVVVFSARELSEEFSQVAGFLSKPIDLDHLLETVARLCHRPSN